MLELKAVVWFAKSGTLPKGRGGLSHSRQPRKVAPVLEGGEKGGEMDCWCLRGSRGICVWASCVICFCCCFFLCVVLGIEHCLFFIFGITVSVGVLKTKSRKEKEKGYTRVKKSDVFSPSEKPLILRTFFFLCTQKKRVYTRTETVLFRGGKKKREVGGEMVFYEQSNCTPKKRWARQ